MEDLLRNLFLVHTKQVIPHLYPGGGNDLILGIAAVARHGNGLHLKEYRGA